MSQNYDLDLIFEAIYGELHNLQASTSSSVTNSSAHIIDNVLRNLNTYLNENAPSTQLVEQTNEEKNKQNEIIMRLKNENKSLKDLVNDVNKKEVKHDAILILKLKIIKL